MKGTIAFIAFVIAFGGIMVEGNYIMKEVVSVQKTITTIKYMDGRQPHIDTVIKTNYGYSNPYTSWLLYIGLALSAFGIIISFIFALGEWIERWGQAEVNE